MSIEKYFLGSATASGFKTPVSELLSDTKNTVYIFKGTAGSGKSTLMKKISEAFKEYPQELYFCSADPYSLDAVYLKEQRAIVIDGTAPHCFDPVYPKAVENLIDLGAYLDTAALRSAKDEIISLTDEYSGCHKRCRLNLAAISPVITDIMTAAKSFIDKERLDSFTEKFIKRIIPKKSGKTGTGRILRKQLSAITMNGYATYVPKDKKIYLLCDENIAAAAMFLEKAAAVITEKGYDIILSECYLSEDRFAEHIIVPELDIAFMSSNCITNLSTDCMEKAVSFKRFYCADDATDGADLRSRIRFGKKAYGEFSKEAAAALIDAKTIHDSIEEHYIKAADFGSLNRLSYKLISDIKGL